MVECPQWPNGMAHAWRIGPWPLVGQSNLFGQVFPHRSDLNESVWFTRSSGRCVVAMLIVALENSGYRRHYTTKPSPFSVLQLQLPPPRYAALIAEAALQEESLPFWENSSGLAAPSKPINPYCMLHGWCLAILETKLIEH